MELPRRAASLTFSTPITSQTSEALLTSVETCADQGVECVKIAIATPGGEVASGLGVFKGLMANPIEVVMHNTGEIASMGNVLFLAGDHRLADSEATFALHPLAIELDGRKWRAADLDVLRAAVERDARNPDPDLLRELDLGIARLRREDRAVRQVLEERTRLTRPEIDGLVASEAVLDASEALFGGIVHEIVVHRP